MSSDERPAAAAGHLFLRAAGVESAAKRLVELGVRPIVIKESFAVLELRGGTHIVVREIEDGQTHEASFDLMFEDLDTARQRFGEVGFEVSAIEEGRIHRGFTATAPEKFIIQVNDSHAGDRPV